MPAPPPSPLVHRFDHLDAWPEATADDLAAFDAYIREWTAHLGVRLPLFVLACLLLWWPLDAAIAPDARFIAVFRDMRALSMAVLIGTSLGFLRSALVRRYVFLSAAVAYAGSLALVGYSLGRLGELAWLADAYIAVVPAAIIPMPLGRRVLATTLITAALPAAYFLPFPANLAAPAAWGQVSFAGFAAALSVLIGEVTLRTVRRSFLQGRSVQREKAKVDTMAASLAQQVLDQSQDLRALAHHLETVQEAERRRLSRDLHDELGQELTAMRYLLEAGQTRVAAQPDATPAVLAQLREVLDRTSRTVRTLILDLRPRLLEDQGLRAAVEWLAVRARESELVTEVRYDDAVDAALSPAAQVALFRCVQEAVTNAVRHSGAAHLTITVARVGADVVATVADDGQGFDAAPPGLGVLGMRERLRAVGGHLTLDAQAGRGVRVVGAVPVAVRAPEDP
jgi:signal transduction histidine kinase